MGEVITNLEEFIEVVTQEYLNDEVCFEADLFLEGIQISAPKRDFLEAYAHLQLKLNGDDVIRLKKFPCEDEIKSEEDAWSLSEEELIPDGWGEEIVTGDAAEIISQISHEYENGGPLFARICGDDESELLDLVYGNFEFDNFEFDKKAQERDI